MDAAKKAKFQEKAKEAATNENEQNQQSESEQTLTGKAKKFAEQQQTDEETDIAEEPEDEDMEEDAEEVQPLLDLPKEFGDAKEQSATVKWWAVLIIVVGSVLLVV